MQPPRTVGLKESICELKETLDSAWRQFDLSLLGRECYWHPMGNDR